MIELAELKEDVGQYHGDDEPVHRIQLHMKIKNPTDMEREALHDLLKDFFNKITLKKVDTE